MSYHKRNENVLIAGAWLGTSGAAVFACGWGVHWAGGAWGSAMILIGGALMFLGILTVLSVEIG